MRSKVAILLVALSTVTSVFVAGCTLLPQNRSGSTGHDAVLQAVMEDDLQAYNNVSWVRQLNQSIQWVNDTSAMVTYRMSGSNLSLSYTAQYTRFGSVAEASAYVRSINQGYNETSIVQQANFPALTTASSYNTHQAYQSVAHNLPTTISYIKTQGDQPTSPASYIIQVNDVVTTFNATLSRTS
jgi:hypothetical protein